jgi:fatty acid desaturase
MSEHRLETGDAASELAEIKRRQAGVIQAVLVPRWYWWVVGLLLVPLGVVTDSHQRVATAVVAVVVALIIAALSVWMITGAFRGARVHPATLGSGGSLYIVGFVWLVVGVTLVTAFGLQAEGNRYPGTLATILAAALLIIGGPILMSLLRRAMVERSPAAPR